ncbi:MAG: DUF262 domain-containing protein [Patescibacteria group bacterium]|nr:DUF262 domain-containing protein [Patescibacteria group bacterium]
MDFFAKSYQLSTILQKKEYEIPEFQREYSWELEQLNEFWNDLQTSDNDFFLGTIVLAGKNFTDHIGPFEIIDGQQRLTTILLLLNRMIEKFEKINEIEIAKILKERLFFKDDNAQTHLVLNNKNAHSFFQKIVLYNEECTDNNIEINNLLAAKKFFEEKIKDYELEELKKLRDNLLKINFIVVVQDNESEAINIFITLNFRGISLNILDLVKSFVVRKYPKKTGIDDPREKWKILLNNIKEDKKNFFNRYWASYFKKVSDIKLYKSFNEKTKVFSQKDTKIFLNKLLEFSEIYRDITLPNDNDFKKYCPHDVKNCIKIREMIISLDKFKIKVHFSFLSALLDLSKNRIIHQKKLEEILEILTNFHYIFNAVCSKRPSGMDQKYSKFSISLREKPNDIDSLITTLKDELKNKIPEKEDFVANFTNLNFNKNKGLILYSYRFLEKIYNPGNNVDITEESLDHISPQSKKEKWCDKIGNLILLEKELNIKRGKKEFKDSNKIISNTCYLSTQDFIKKFDEPWKESNVDDRSKDLAIKIYDFIITKYF